MKCIASTEANPALQDIMFKCSKKYEILDEELETFKKNVEELQIMIENIKKHMTQPLKVRIPCIFMILYDNILKL